MNVEEKVRESRNTGTTFRTKITTRNIPIREAQMGNKRDAARTERTFKRASGLKGEERKGGKRHKEVEKKRKADAFSGKMIEAVAPFKKKEAKDRRTE